MASVTLRAAASGLDWTVAAIRPNGRTGRVWRGRGDRRVSCPGSAAPAGSAVRPASPRSSPMPAARMRHRLWIVLALVALAGSAGLAQVQPAASRAPVTAADYSRAEKFLAATVNPLVVGGSVTVNRLPGERFWYRSVTPDGVTFYVVTPAAKSRVPAFDHAKLAAALATAAGATIDPKQLPFQTIQFSADGTSVSFDYDRRRWTCDVQGAACASSGDAAGADAAAGGAAAGAAARARGRRSAGRDVAGRQARGVHQGLEPRGPRRGDQAGDRAHDGRREGLRLRHRQRRLGLERARHRALVARLEEDRHLPAGRAQGRRHVPGRDEGRPPGAPVLEVPAARRRARRDDAPRRHRGRHRARRPIPDAARLPPGDARRQLQPERHAVEPRRVPAGLRVHVARSQAGGRARGRRRHRRRSDGVRGDREDALRVARRLAGALGVERDHLVVAARQLESALPLRPQDGGAEEPDHDRRGAGHPDRDGGREDPHHLVHGHGPREGAGPVLPAPLQDRFRRPRPRLAHAGRWRSRGAAVGHRRLHRRHLLDVREAARGRAARRRGPAGDAAREGRRHEADGHRLEAARCRSS